jgi:glucokinase
VQQGYGCLTLQKHEVKHLFGPDDLCHLPIGPKVCIGAGTGLGECYLTPNDTAHNGEEAITYTCFASEGGHVEYAPRNDLEIQMLRYLSDEFGGNGRISVERVVSGVGLANVYKFLAKTFKDRIVPSVHEEFLKAGDEQGRVVAQAASRDDDDAMDAVTTGSSSSTPSLYQQAMSIMMSAYGCEVGSAAMKWIPTGGLFVTGGLTPKNIKYIEGLETDFMKSYLHKGRVRPLLDRVPLFAVMVEDLGVRGVHKAALMEYEKYQERASSSRSKWSWSLVDVQWMQLNGLLAVAAAATAMICFSAGAAWRQRR